MKGKKKILGVGLALLVLAVAGAGIYYVQVVQKERKSYETYLEGFELYKAGDYEKAEKLLLSVKDYGETQTILTDLYYQEGLEAFEAEDYEAARELFLKNPDYQDSADYIKETAYQLGVAACSKQEYDQAETYFQDIQNYKDVSDYLDTITYARLEAYFAAGEYDQAESCIFSIPDQDGVQPYGIVVLQEQAQKAFESQDYTRTLELYERALEYRTWVEEVYNNLPEEEKNGTYAAICGQVSYEERIQQMDTDYASAKKEYQAVTCLQELISYYEEKMADTAVLSQVDEVRLAMQTYSADNVVPVIMISYKETVTENKKEVQRQAYAVYNETDFYAICHSLNMDEIDKSNSDEVQANLKITQYWDTKDTLVVDMTRIRKAMGWE